MWKFKCLKGRDKWLFLLTVGVIVCILAFPAEKIFDDGGKSRKDGSISWMDGSEGQTQEAAYGSIDSTSYTEPVREASAKAEASYEAELEHRVKEILKYVDGVGEVDVMIVLESSAEKVWQSDGSSTVSLTEEKDSGGGSRKIESRDNEHTTVLVSGDGRSEPMLQKELRPQISGIIISASGGGSPTVQAEISAAMEALFGLPAHKIKVLKRVE